VPQTHDNRKNGKICLRQNKSILLIRYRSYITRIMNTNGQLWDREDIIIVLLTFTRVLLLDLDRIVIIISTLLYVTPRLPY